MNLQRRILLAVLIALPTGPLPAQTWHWSNPLPNGNTITGLAQNGSVTVEVAELGQLYVGNDFYDWVSRTVPTTNDFQAVTFFGNRLVALGENGTVVYSDDYVNFTNANLNSAPNWLIAVAASPSRLVAVGDNALIYTSTNGANWTAESKPPNVGSSWLVSAAYGNGTFVIGGDGGYIATSLNGVTWTSHILSGTSQSIFWLSYVPGSGSTTNFPYAGFWAVTDGGQAWYSTNNGAGWKQFSTGSTNAFYSLAANKTSGLLAGDRDVRLGASPANWIQQTGTHATNAPVWTYYDSLWDSNGDYQLAGAEGLLVQGNAFNGSVVWAPEYGTPLNPIVYDWLFQVMSVQGLYVAVGDHARIMTSDNGADWTVETLPKTNSISTTNSILLCVGGDTNLLIAAGNQGSLAISPLMLIPVVQTNLDGTLATNFASSLGVLWYSMPAPTTNELTAVGVYGNRYYLTGGRGTVLTSSDGTNWVHVPVPLTNDLSGIAASANQLVIVGDKGSILTSSNGADWTVQTSGTTSGLFRVHWFDGLFLAIGEHGTVLLSTNGSNWHADNTGTTNWLNDAVMVSNTCYVVGNYGTILASTNFINWSGVPTITPLSLYGAATQNGQLVVVGLDGSILRSQIVPVSTPVCIESYAQVGGDNLFLILGVVDQQFTLDSSTNLTAGWTTGPLLDLMFGDGTLEVVQPQGTNSPAQRYFRCTLAP